MNAWSGPAWQVVDAELFLIHNVERCVYGRFHYLPNTPLTSSLMINNTLSFLFSLLNSPFSGMINMTSTYPRASHLLTQDTMRHI